MENLTVLVIELEVHTYHINRTFVKIFVHSLVPCPKHCVQLISVLVIFSICVLGLEDDVF